EEGEDLGAEGDHRMMRIGEPDAVLAVDHEVARLIVALAVEQRLDGDEPAIGHELDQPPAAFLRPIELTAGTERKTVDAVDVAPYLADGPVRWIEAQQTTVVDGGKQYRRAVPDDPPGRTFERAGDELELPSHRQLLRDWDARNAQPGPQHAMVGRDVEGAPIIIAPGKIGAMAGDEQAAEKLAALVHDMDAARPGAIDVVFLINLHAVGDARLVAGELVKQPSGPDATVLVDVEGADDPEAGVVDVKQRLVLRERKPVGIDAVGDHERDVSCRRQAEDTLNIELALQIIADHAGYHEPTGGIGPIDCAVGAHHDVVWAVEFPALVSLRERDERAVRFDAPDRARRPAGNDHAALPVDGHAVGVARGMNQHLLADAGAPLPAR